MRTKTICSILGRFVFALILGSAVWSYFKCQTAELKKRDSRPSGKDAKLMEDYDDWSAWNLDDDYPEWLQDESGVIHAKKGGGGSQDLDINEFDYLNDDKIYGDHFSGSDYMEIFVEDRDYDGLSLDRTIGFVDDEDEDNELDFKFDHQLSSYYGMHKQNFKNKLSEGTKGKKKQKGKTQNDKGRGTAERKSGVKKESDPGQIAQDAGKDAAAAVASGNATLEAGKQKVEDLKKLKPDDKKDTKKDDTKKDDAKKDGAKKDDAKKDDAKKDDAKKEEAKKDDAKKGDAKKDDKKEAHKEEADKGTKPHATEHKPSPAAKDKTTKDSAPKEKKEKVGPGPFWIDLLIILFLVLGNAYQAIQNSSASKVLQGFDTTYSDVSEDYPSDGEKKDGEEKKENGEKEGEKDAKDGENKPEEAPKEPGKDGAKPEEQAKPKEDAAKK